MTSSIVELHAPVATEWWRLDNNELSAAPVAAEEQSRRAYNTILEMLAEAQSRDLADIAGYPDLIELQRDLLHVSRKEAKRRLAHMDAVLPRRGLGGVEIPARLEATGQALREAAISVEHVETIVRNVAELPRWASVDDVERAGQMMADVARTTDAGGVNKVAQRIHAWLDQDGRPPIDDPILAGHNELHLTTRSNGRLLGRFDLDPETSTLVETVLSALTAPTTEPPGEPPRTSPERRGDALAEVFRLAADTGELPAEGGEKPT